MSRLPRGYLQLEYIQSTGTQYVDTRFLPNQNTRVVIDFKSTFSTANSPKGLLGCRNSSDIGLFAFLYSNRIDPNYNGVGKSVTVDSLQRHVYDFNKNSFSVDGAAVSFDAGVFSPGYNLLLLSLQNYGAIDARKAEGYLYASQIYDNGTLVRDFVPCVSPSGAVGLFDLVGREFYGNDGTGTFTAGPVVLPVLPRGYKRLQYIQSSGAQYVDTGFVPNQDTRVVAEFETQSNNGDWRCVFGARTTGNNAQSLGFYLSNADVFSGFYGNSKQFSFPGIGVAGVHTVDWNKNTITLDGTAQTVTAQTYNSTVSLYICSVHTPVVADTHYLQGKIYSCQVYDDGVLARDYLPARTSDGDVGLYDNVDGLFYPNAGTGVFLAGPEVEQTPAAPTGFTASVEGDKVTLRWDAKDEVLGYRVYRDGLLLADTTATEIEDTVAPFAKTGYAVTAYNDLVEGKAAELTVYFLPENPMLYLVTDRTAADVAAGNAKGSYTATDLNRVGYAMLYIADIVTKQGIDAPVTPKTDWTGSDWVDAGDAEAYLRDLATLRNAVAVMSTTPNPPADLEQFGFQQANDIEQILVDIHVMLSLVLNNLLYAGEIFAGEA